MKFRHARRNDSRRVSSTKIGKGKARLYRGKNVGKLSKLLEMPWMYFVKWVLAMIVYLVRRRRFVFKIYQGPQSTCYVSVSHPGYLAHSLHKIHPRASPAAWRVYQRSFLDIILPFPSLSRRRPAGCRFFLRGGISSKTEVIDCKKSKSSRSRCSAHHHWCHLADWAIDSAASSLISSHSRGSRHRPHILQSWACHWWGGVNQLTAPWSGLLTLKWSCEEWQVSTRILRTTAGQPIHCLTIQALKRNVFIWSNGVLPSTLVRIVALSASRLIWTRRVRLSLHEWST